MSEQVAVAPAPPARESEQQPTAPSTPAAARSRSAVACEPHFRPGDDGYVLYRVGGDGDGYLLCLVPKANGR